MVRWREEGGEEDFEYRGLDRAGAEISSRGLGGGGEREEG